jgi:hypothetical protein
VIDTIATWDEFRQKWKGGQNILLRGEVFPYTYASPPLSQVIDAVRQNERARIVTGRRAERPEATSMTSSTYLEFRDLPIEEAVRAPVQLSHFEVNEFTAPGQVLEGLKEMFDDWYATLAAHGFSCTATQRAMFLSGPHSHTNYHIDGSYVLAWQILGRKRFCFTKDPERWCNREMRRQYSGRYDLMVRPADLTSDDIIEVEMQPGDVLWNSMMTPHWVYSLDETSYSLNLVHVGLRCDGELSAMGHELEQIRREREAVKAAS